MIKTINMQVRKSIESGLNKGCKKFIIYPYGDVGMQANDILIKLFSIEPAFIIDNKYCKYNSNIKPISILDKLNCNEYMVILASTNEEIYSKLKADLLKKFDPSMILELECMRNHKPLRTQIRQSIELGLIRGEHFIIYQFGDEGRQVKDILKSEYSIEPSYIIDDKYGNNTDIKSVNYLDEIDCSKYMVILFSTSKENYCGLKKELLKRLDSSRILELESMRAVTICGKT